MKPVVILITIVRIYANIYSGVNILADSTRNATASLNI